MSTVENMEKNKVKISFSADAETFEKGMEYSYNKNKGAISIQGFRKGKAPRKLIEAQYGKAIFYDDAVNYILPEAYDAAVAENNLEVVSKPEIDVTAIDENGVSFTAEVWIKPEVNLGEYKGLTYTKKDPNPTDEDIDAELKKEQEKAARIVDVTDRAVQNGDIANIDFKGYIDDVAFEGGEGEGFDLEIGSHSFIDNFEEQLIGAEIGQDVVVNVTFPENYGKEDLANKPAKFEVKINSIKVKELPELTDEFIQDTTECENLKDYRNEICGNLLAENIKRIDAEKEEELINKLVDVCEMDVPQAMIDSDVEMKIQEYAYQLQQQGIGLDMYLQYMGQTMDSMKEAYKPLSEKHVKARLALEAVAKAENIEVTDDDVKAEAEKVAKAYNMEAEQIMQSADFVNTVKADLLRQKALKVVEEAAKEA
ncbi:MAG: trigger factor [Clostridia bacterium]|nr:trigger factor [Clostridia bacterium]